MSLKLFQVDAFASATFRGNPAAIVPLDSWLSDVQLQQIAEENNLSETAFFVVRGDGTYDLRWFTPSDEVDLCGHATLASAYTLFAKLNYAGDAITFHTRSGPLVVSQKADGWLRMDFPATPTELDPNSADFAGRLEQVLGVGPTEVRRGPNLMAVFDSAADVDRAAYSPGLGGALKEMDSWGLIITAPADADNEIDFVSRFFAPLKGVPEDPVTGSAHCALAPYWASRLNKKLVTGFQRSKRGGLVKCQVDGDRVFLEGQAQLYLEGEIFV